MQTKKFYNLLLENGTGRKPSNRPYTGHKDGKGSYVGSGQNSVIQGNLGDHNRRQARNIEK